jgi:hypothetical protein
MRKRNWLPIIAIGLGLALVVALFSPWASSHPDGLERVAEDKEFIDNAKDPSFEIIPDYAVPGIENEKVATILSGIIGIVIVAGLGFGLTYGMKALSGNKNSSDRQSSPPAA